jgi:hypothetical protein
MTKTMTSIEALEKASEIAHLCGGTRSSECLVVALNLMKEATNDKDRERLKQQVEIWKNQLKAHNAQPRRFVRYDIETGHSIPDDPVDN